MKKLTYIAAAVLFVACGGGEGSNEETPATDTTATEETAEEAAPETGNFGAEITEEGALSVDAFMAAYEGNTSMDAKITATVGDVCQKKGCWMMVDLGNGEEMRVRFKDYGFFVPMTSTGKTVVMEGVAYNDTTSVEDLKHYAEDAGQSQEEIDAITEPEISMAFEATGVIIK